MDHHSHHQFRNRVDVQVIFLTTLLVISACLGVVWVYETLGQEHDFHRLLVIIVVSLSCALGAVCAILLFRRISNPCTRSLATIDYLTEMNNRNAFDVSMSNLDSRRAEGIGIILVDLNDLKVVNDTMGHAYGDRYLRRAADVINAHQNHTRTAYRVGGDEFVLLCSSATEAQLATLSHRICSAYDTCRPGWPVSTSLSVGWALYQPDCDPTFQDTLRRADEAMYFYKRTFHNNNTPT